MTAQGKPSAAAARGVPFSSAPPLLLLLSSLLLSTPRSLFLAEAIELASLGATLGGAGGGAGRTGRADVLEQEVGDLSSLACSSSDGASSSSPASSSPPPATCASRYGVDVSFPIHRPASDLPFMDADSKEFYEAFVRGCRERYGAEGYKCDGSEGDRVAMNLRQPAGMRNYTTLGFAKIRAPASMTALLAKFWTNKFRSLSNVPNETWDVGNTYTNHWSSPTKMINLDPKLRKSVWDAARPPLEEWSRAELHPASLYGVRIYTEGSMLAPHVDRNPLVISAVVNVAQDVDEPWPLEVYGHDGNAYNVTMEVGDMILYESHSVVHGRPFPLKGRYYANVFIHFEPLGHTLEYEEENAEDEETLERLYQRAWKKLQAKCADDEECEQRVDLNVESQVPYYIVPGSEEERRWIQTHPRSKADVTTFVKGLSAHTAASTGDLDTLRAIAKENPDAMRHKDNNGWNPLHEAVRGGHVDIVRWLLKYGLDKDERTHNGNGGSPMWWAKKTHGHDHPMVEYLKSLGAKEIPPQGHKKIKNEE